MANQQKWVLAIAVCLLTVLGGNGIYAEEPSAKTKSVVAKPLAESVNKIVQIMIYVDTRLLSEENIKRIEESGNYEAIAVLHRSLSDRELIGAQINQGRFEEAYMAMQGIVDRIAILTKLSWANEYMFQKTQGQIDSEHLIGDAYFKRAQQSALVFNER